MAKPNDDRRRKIDEIKRKQRSSARRGNIIAIAAALAVGGLLIGLAVFEASKKDRAQSRALDSIGGTPDAAGCTEVREEDPKSGNASHVQGTLTYPNPPSNGPHNPTWVTNVPRDRFWARGEGDQPEKIVHSLEHGYVVVWYDPDLPADQIELLKQVGAAENSRKFLIAPWERGKFEGDHDVALTAWARMRLCRQVSGEAIEDFIHDYQGNGPKSVAPEPAGP